MKRQTTQDAVNRILKHAETMKLQRERLRDYQVQFAKRAREYKFNAKFNDPAIEKMNSISKIGKVNLTEEQKQFSNLVDDSPLSSWKHNFFSSNVKAFKTRENNLLVQFLDNSIYAYFGASKLFESLYNAGSKGKWVWRNLIRTSITYAKIR